MNTRSRLRFGLGCLLLSAGVRAEWSVGYDGFGPLKFGMSLEQVDRLVGATLLAPAVPGMDPSGRCFQVPLPHQDGIDLMFIDRRLARVDVSRPGVKALGFVQIGSPEAQVRERLGPRLQTARNDYADAGTYLTAAPASGRNGVRFEVDGGRVRLYYAGLRGAIRQTEGCG